MATASDPRDARLVAFLYLIARDHLPTGAIEEAIAGAQAAASGVAFSSPHLAAYAADFAARLVEPAPETPRCEACAHWTAFGPPEADDMADGQCRASGGPLMTAYANARGVGFLAELRTRADFYCALFEARA